MSFSLPEFSLPPLSRQKIMAVVLVVVIFISGGVLAYFLDNGPKGPKVTVHTSSYTLQGLGQLQPLHTTMARDRGLGEAVAALHEISAVDIFVRPQETNRLVAEILFRWARADLSTPGAYGPAIDARIVEFLKHAGVVPATVSPGTELTPEQVAEMQVLWSRGFNHFRTRLLAQANGRDIFGGDVSYNVVQDTMTVKGALSPDFIQSFQRALNNAAQGGEMMRGFLDFVDATKGLPNLDDAEHDMIMGLEMRTR